MSQQKVKFTQEFKPEAVKLVTEQGYSQSCKLFW
jgi:transposase-like protein